MILIAGPCVIESKDKLFRDAENIKKHLEKFPEIDYYFKASCVKDNRTRINNFPGVGFHEGYELRENMMHPRVHLLRAPACELQHGELFFQHTGDLRHRFPVNLTFRFNTRVPAFARVENSSLRHCLAHVLPEGPFR